jgi:hypothetical protein
MPYAFPRRALTQLALVGFAVCFDAALSSHSLAQSPGASETQSPAGEAAAPAPDAALEPGAVAADAQAQGEAETGDEQVSPLVAHQRKTLQISLEQVNSDRAEASTLLPWLVTGIGASMVIVGLILGAESSIGCGDSCGGASAAPGWLAVLGSALGTAGLIWTLNTKRDIDQIESREYRIRSELERLDWHTAPRQQSSVSPRLSLRGSF